MRDKLRAELALPAPDTLLDRHEFAARLGCCAQSVERYLRRIPDFPRPVRAGRRKSSARLWVEADVATAHAALARTKSTRKPLPVLALDEQLGGDGGYFYV